MWQMFNINLKLFFYIFMSNCCIINCIGYLCLQWLKKKILEQLLLLFFLGADEMLINHILLKKKILY